MKKRILLLLSLALIFVVSCGKHPAVKDFEDSMKFIQSAEYGKNANTNQFQNMGLTEDTVKALVNASKKITYKINKTETKKDQAIINVTMKAPDLSGLQKELMQKITSIDPKEFEGKTQAEAENIGKDMANKLITEKLNSADLKFKEETFDVIYSKSGNKWILDPMANLTFVNMTSFGMVNQ